MFLRICAFLPFSITLVGIQEVVKINMCSIYHFSSRLLAFPVFKWFLWVKFIVMESTFLLLYLGSVYSFMHSINIFGAPAMCQILHWAVRTQGTGKRTGTTGSGRPGSSLNSDTLQLWASQFTLLSHIYLLVKNRSVEVGWGITTAVHPLFNLKMKGNILRSLNFTPWTSRLKDNSHPSHDSICYFCCCEQ